MKIIKYIKATWELPQNALGFIVKKICKATPYTTYKDAEVYSWKINGGMSLGKYIFLPFNGIDPSSQPVQHYIKHEYGHTIQSKYLGWFYLLVIGLPSLIWSQIYSHTHLYKNTKGASYYDFYTEKWANKLGGVDEK